MKPMIQYFNQIKDRFWVVMILVPLVTFAIGFLLTTVILLATGKFGIVYKVAEEIPEVEIEAPVVNVQTVIGSIELEPANLYFVQLGSFNAQSNAEAACENIEDKNIYASWIKSNTQYKVFTALTFSESSARSYRNTFVEMRSDHQDAYVDSVSVEFKTFEFWADRDEIVSVKEDFYDFYYASDQFWMNISDEINVSTNLIIDQIEPLQRILEILNTYDENNDIELTKFVQDSLNEFQEMIDKNANGSEYSGSYAEQLLELTR